MQDEFNFGEISLDGFQVVRGHYFSRQLEPLLTMWYSSISFNMSAFSALHNCESVSIMVNNKTRCVIIKPISSKDKDAINWLKPPENHKYRKLECTRFTQQLFLLWEWNKELHYRTNGRLVTADKKLMLLFDFSRPEVWRGLKMVSDFE